MNDIDLDAIEALAKAATGCRWSKGYKSVYADTGDEVASCTTDRIITNRQAEANAAFIAAANPAVVLELIAELRAKNDLLEEIFDDCGGKDSGACPVCHTYTHKHWCWYPHLAKMLGKPLDENDERFLAEERNGRT